MERRLLQRQKTNTRVYVKAGKDRYKGRCKNLTAMGAFIQCDLQLYAGAVVEIAFVIHLESQIRLHFRRAVVAHCQPDGIGVMLQGRRHALI